MADDAAGAVVIAVCGKGGVGKTTVSAIITRILLERTEARVLAIDADPAAGLAASLGFSPRVTVDDVRTRFIDELGKTGAVTGPIFSRGSITGSSARSRSGAASRFSP